MLASLQPFHGGLHLARCFNGGKVQLQFLQEKDEHELKECEYARIRILIVVAFIEGTPTSALTIRPDGLRIEVDPVRSIPLIREEPST